MTHHPPHHPTPPGSPALPQPQQLRQGAGVGAYRPPVVVDSGPNPGARVPRQSLPQAVSTLTVYPDGFSCLNATGSKLVATFATASLSLFAPPPVRTGRRPRLWEIGAGNAHALSAHPDKPAQLRFRVPPAEAPAPGRYALVPVPGEAQRFGLLPL